MTKTIKPNLATSKISPSNFIRSVVKSTSNSQLFIFLISDKLNDKRSSHLFNKTLILGIVSRRF